MTWLARATATRSCGSERARESAMAARSSGRDLAQRSSAALPRCEGVGGAREVDRWPWSCVGKVEGEQHLW
jgi:hypothetical protein